MKPGERTTLAIPDPHPSGTGWLPQWVTDQIHTPAPLARRAVFTTCRHCQEIIIHGLDADLLAEEVRADPTPLTTPQEVACILAGRPTYQIQITNQDLKIIDRQARWQTPGNKPRRPIIPKHQCGARFPGFIIPPLQQQEPQQQPPF